jgi:hypothetical protein
VPLGTPLAFAIMALLCTLAGTISGRLTAPKGA